jgi:thiamine kinase-like enzyme
MRDDVRDIALMFLPKAQNNDLEIMEISSGLINQSFKVKTFQSVYVLQRINHFVFLQPKLIHHNYKKVKGYLLANGFSKQTLSFLIDDKGEDVKNINDEYWRMSEFIDGETYGVCTNPILAYNSARVLAEFHYCLKEMDTAELEVPIKGFCDFTYRVKQFKGALISGNLKRMTIAKNLIKAVNANLHYISEYIEVEKNIVKRTIHGDPKVSNFLFDRTNDYVISLIDIDTIMPGTILYDFGDMVRSFANNSNEDSTMNKKSFKSDVYESLKNGYLSIGEQFMTQEEKSSLGLSAMCVSLIQCIRFLTDYLNSDVYYKVTEPKQNLNRATNQFTFYKELKEYLIL